MKKLIVLIVLFCCRIGIVYSDSVIFLGEFYLFFPSAHTSAIEPKITVGFDDTYCSFQIKAFSDYTVVKEKYEIADTCGIFRRELLPVDWKVVKQKEERKVILIPGSSIQLRVGRIYWELMQKIIPSRA